MHLVNNNKIMEQGNLLSDAPSSSPPSGLFLNPLQSPSAILYNSGVLNYHLAYPRNNAYYAIKSSSYNDYIDTYHYHHQAPPVPPINSLFNKASRADYEDCYEESLPNFHHHQRTITGSNCRQLDPSDDDGDGTYAGFWSGGGDCRSGRYNATNNNMVNSLVQEWDIRTSDTTNYNMSVIHCDDDGGQVVSTEGVYLEDNLDINSPYSDDSTGKCVDPHRCLCKYARYYLSSCSYCIRSL